MRSKRLNFKGFLDQAASFLGDQYFARQCLALAVAAAHTAAFADGVAFVALASVSTPFQIVSAIGPDHEGPLVVYDFIGWPHGQFEFDRGALVEGTSLEADFNALLLEGCRRLDERRRGVPVETSLAPGASLPAEAASAN